MVHAQQFAAGDAVVEIAVFDVGHRHPRQCQRMHVLHAGVAGDVEHAGQIAATEDLVRGEIVLAATHFHRTAFDDRRADRIGADLGFAPACAGHQRHPARLVEEARAAFGVEDPAGRAAASPARRSCASRRVFR
ncbi:hypothetical protein NB693_20300 [Pantoea ananatis]|uniref:hypothetical protein n=1 Tax=Pantoea ananas TaxID=553 RepID=UPI00222021C8|nr:hypothetical protein [Pantoea ananatis]